MESLKKNKVALVGIAIILFSFFAYKFFFPPVEPLTSTESSSSAGLVGQDLISELNRLKKLSNMDTSLFENPIFLGLKDISVSIQQKPIGRVNPFLPVGQ